MHVQVGERGHGLVEEACSDGLPSCLGAPRVPFQHTYFVKRALPYRLVYASSLYQNLCFIGWAVVGWQRHSKTNRSPREEGNQGTFYLSVFGRSPTAGRRVRSVVRGKSPYIRTRESIVSRSVHGKAPQKHLHRTTIAISGSGYSGN